LDGMHIFRKLKKFAQNRRFYRLKKTDLKNLVQKSFEESKRFILILGYILFERESLPAPR
jgi:hypothetical protein